MLLAIHFVAEETPEKHLTFRRPIRMHNIILIANQSKVNFSEHERVTPWI